MEVKSKSGSETCRRTLESQSTAVMGVLSQMEWDRVEQLEGIEFVAEEEVEREKGHKEDNKENETLLTPRCLALSQKSARGRRQCVVVGRFKHIQGKSLLQWRRELSSREAESETKSESALDTIVLIFKDLVDTVATLHERDISHMDLKLENVLISEESQGAPTIQLIDFTQARLTRNERNSLCKKFTGSLHYLSPEIVSNTPYLTKKHDVWCLGVILCGLLTGRFPFSERSKEQTLRNILNHSFSLDLSLFQLDPLALDLIHALLNPDPSLRPSAAQTLAHPFLSVPPNTNTTC